MYLNCFYRNDFQQITIDDYPVSAERGKQVPITYRLNPYLKIRIRDLFIKIVGKNLVISGSEKAPLMIKVNVSDYSIKFKNISFANTIINSRKHVIASGNNTAEKIRCWACGAISINVGGVLKSNSVELIAPNVLHWGKIQSVFTSIWVTSQMKGNGAVESEKTHFNVTSSKGSEVPHHWLCLWEKETMQMAIVSEEEATQMGDTISTPLFVKINLDKDQAQLLSIGFWEVFFPFIQRTFQDLSLHLDGQCFTLRGSRRVDVLKVEAPYQIIDEIRSCESGETALVAIDTMTHALAHQDHLLQQAVIQIQKMVQHAQQEWEKTVRTLGEQNALLRFEIKAMENRYEELNISYKAQNEAHNAQLVSFKTKGLEKELLSVISIILTIRGQDAGRYPSVWKKELTDLTTQFIKYLPKYCTILNRASFIKYISDKCFNIYMNSYLAFEWKGVRPEVIAPINEQIQEIFKSLPEEAFTSYRQECINSKKRLTKVCEKATQTYKEKISALKMLQETHVPLIASESSSALDIFSSSPQSAMTVCLQDYHTMKSTWETMIMELKADNERLKKELLFNENQYRLTEELYRQILKEEQRFLDFGLHYYSKIKNEKDFIKETVEKLFHAFNEYGRNSVAAGLITEEIKDNF